jgi:cation transport ATPase
MGFKIPKTPKIPKLDPALLKKIPEIVNNVAFKIIEGTSPGEAVESEIKDQIKEAVMREIEPMLGGNKLVVKLADKAVEKSIDKMWGKIKETLAKKMAGEDIGEIPAAPSSQETQYQQQTYYTEQSYKKEKNNNSAYGTISLTLGLMMVFGLVIAIMTGFSSSSFYYLAFALYFGVLFIGFIFGVVGAAKDRKKPMGIIGLIIDVIFFLALLVFVL